MRSAHARVNGQALQQVYTLGTLQVIQIDTRIFIQNKYLSLLFKIIPAKPSKTHHHFTIRHTQSTRFITIISMYLTAHRNYENRKQILNYDKNMRLNYGHDGKREGRKTKKEEKNEVAVDAAFDKSLHARTVYLRLVFSFFVFIYLLSFSRSLVRM